MCGGLIQGVSKAKCYADVTLATYSKFLKDQGIFACLHTPGVGIRGANAGRVLGEPLHCPPETTLLLGLKGYDCSEDPSDRIRPLSYIELANAVILHKTTGCEADLLSCIFNKHNESTTFLRKRHSIPAALKMHLTQHSRLHTCMKSSPDGFISESLHVHFRNFLGIFFRGLQKSEAFHDVLFHGVSGKRP